MKTTSADGYLTGLDTSLTETSLTVRPVIDATLTDATCVMWHGHPVWGLGETPGRRPICLLKAYTSYVTFGLWRGQEIVDRSGRLIPGARQMASVRLSTPADVDEPPYAFRRNIPKQAGGMSTSNSTRCCMSGIRVSRSKTGTSTSRRAVTAG
ncbi:DUF1801 domain-containing protein [Micromonospora sp. WMMD1102]|uniref:DUF1801 domain-containing protein n=1 Tax=Micromonospora sp. WMMD1102 TaxID=3016105 RepID=UPI0024156A32|nr:DUF1801 domain-containing protein [Micromonospora sp. WMMD1102]MDG4785610.1 DUF1801 domain-containing protein [Micromonospora sp. WMMD1102]